MSAQLHRRRRQAPKGRHASPHWLGRLPYLIVLSGVGGGLALCAGDYFRKGASLIAAAILFGALARLTLPPSQVGMLETRKKWLDVATLAFFAVSIAVVAWTIPVDK